MDSQLLAAARVTCTVRQPLAAEILWICGLWQHRKNKKRKAKQKYLWRYHACKKWKGSWQRTASSLLLQSITLGNPVLPLFWTYSKLLLYSPWASNQTAFMWESSFRLSAANLCTFVVVTVLSLILTVLALQQLHGSFSHRDRLIHHFQQMALFSLFMWTGERMCTNMFP